MNQGAFEPKKAIEALLIASSEPLKIEKISQVIGISQKETTLLINEIQKEFSKNHGFEVKETSKGFYIYSANEYANFVNAIIDNELNPINLSVPAIETLAVISYRQPISRGEISNIRGVNSDSSVKTLLTYGLIEGLSKNENTNAVLWTTTEQFLEKMGIKSLDELEHLRPHIPDLAN